MSAQLINFLPWVSFIAGLGGSLHCVGMCGGLVTASCEKTNDVFRYQLGRLLGYLILGAFAGFLGSFLNFKNVHPLIAIGPGVFIGVLFIYWGHQSYRGKRAELPVPRFFNHMYTRLWRTLVQKNKNLTRAFFTGLISIFLPCGLLYGVVLGTVALQHSFEALISMFFFWLGTVPTMVIAPQLVKGLIRPLKRKLPKVYAISLILIGVFTVSMRIVSLQQDAHAGTAPEAQHKVSCH